MTCVRHVEADSGEDVVRFFRCPSCGTINYGHIVLLFVFPGPFRRFECGQCSAMLKADMRAFSFWIFTTAVLATVAARIASWVMIFAVEVVVFNAALLAPPLLGGRLGMQLFTEIGRKS